MQIDSRYSWVWRRQSQVRFREVTRVAIGFDIKKCQDPIPQIDVSCVKVPREGCRVHALAPRAAVAQIVRKGMDVRARKEN
eukprot:1625317-Pleurochrysis_carterae.AAC.5